jgi:hypothetical protein
MSPMPAIAITSTGPVADPPRGAPSESALGAAIARRSPACRGGQEGGHRTLRRFRRGDVRCGAPHSGPVGPMRSPTAAVTAFGTRIADSPAQRLAQPMAQRRVLGRFAPGLGARPTRRLKRVCRDFGGWARLVSNQRPLACEAWRSRGFRATKYLQILPNNRARKCSALGLIRPNTAGFGPTNGPTARSTGVIVGRQVAANSRGHQAG